MRDEIRVSVPPHLFDGMFEMTIPIEVDTVSKVIKIDFMTEYGNGIHRDVVDASLRKYPGYDVNIFR